MNESVVLWCVTALVAQFLSIFVIFTIAFIALFVVGIVVVHIPTTNNAMNAIVAL